MAAVFDPSLMMTNEYYRENYSIEFGPSSKEIEEVLGMKLDKDEAEFLDSITSEEAHKLLCEILADVQVPKKK